MTTITHTAHGYSAWIARITGADEQYGLAREFVLKRDITYAKYNKGRDWEWDLSEGIYEYDIEYSRGRHDRGFWRVENGELVDITREDVDAAIAPQPEPEANPEASVLTVTDWAGETFEIPADADGATTASWIGTNLSANAWHYPDEGVTFLPYDCQGPESETIDPGTREAVGRWVEATTGAEAIILNGAPRSLERFAASLAEAERVTAAAREARDVAIRAAHADGLSKYRIAKIVGISQQAVAKIIG